MSSGLGIRVRGDEYNLSWISGLCQGGIKLSGSTEHLQMGGDVLGLGRGCVPRVCLARYCLVFSSCIYLFFFSPLSSFSFISLCFDPHSVLIHSLYSYNKLGSSRSLTFIETELSNPHITKCDKPNIPYLSASPLRLKMQTQLAMACTDDLHERSDTWKTLHMHTRPNMLVKFLAVQSACVQGTSRNHRCLDR